MKKNLWFLTEERPKKEVLITIFQKFAKDHGYAVFIDSIRILPILKENKFTFTYEIIGFRCNKVNRVFIKTVSGNSSFIDYLIFYQLQQPTIKDEPIYAIEETKTDDKESRNTGVYQRCSKFVFINNYYPKVKKIMLYNLKIQQKDKPTQTYIFGTKLLLTLDVEILGKNLDSETFTKFENYDEIIDFKTKMRKAHKSNVPISITKSKSKIEISGRLIKSGRLAYDPNIGALSIISNVLRLKGWDKKIEITKHGLIQEQIGKTNKFIQIANKLNISLKGLKLPKLVMPEDYWKYDIEGEKLGTIFIHLLVENFTMGYSIFENHAGSEKGYFYPLNGDPIPLAKYKDKKKYKAGDKTEIINIPDLVLVDLSNKIIIEIEGKKYHFRNDGIKELIGYDAFDKIYVKQYYPKFKVTRTVVLYGSTEEEIIEIEIGFLLNQNGQIILGVKAPKLFKEAVKNLLDFWK
jgi:hypothetical protein